MSWLTDLHAYLISEGVGTSENIFRENMPASPAACMALTGYGGQKPTKDTNGDMVKKPRLQVIVRHTDADAARAWLLLAEQELVALVNATVGTTTILGIESLESEPMPLGWDSNRNIRLSQNFEVTTR